MENQFITCKSEVKDNLVPSILNLMGIILFSFTSGVETNAIVFTLLMLSLCPNIGLKPASCTSEKLNICLLTSKYVSKVSFLNSCKSLLKTFSCDIVQLKCYLLFKKELKSATNLEK